MARLPLLDREVAGYLKTGKHLHQPSKSHLSVDEKHTVIWGMTRGWSVEKTARAIGRGGSTVWRYRNKIATYPKLVFSELNLYVQLAPHSFQCRICGESRSTRTKAMRHVLAHILPEEIARGVPLAGLRKPL